MADQGFDPYHVPQQSRRDKLRVLSQAQPGLVQACSGSVPIYDPTLISSDLLSCANLHRQAHSVADNSCKQSPNPRAAAKQEGAIFNMGYVGGMISVSSSSSATSHVYMDPRSSIQLNPSSIQDISPNPFLYNPQGLRFLDQTSFHGGGGEVVAVYRPEPLFHESNNNNNVNLNSTCGQGLCLSLSSHHPQQPTSLPLELNLQRYDSSTYSTKCFVPAGIVTSGPGADASTSNGLSRSSVPLGPFTGYASILKGSRFLRPAQQLLEEICDVGRGIYAEKVAADSVLLDPSPPSESIAGSGTDDDPPNCGTGGEHRRKKSRLMSMLDEVYKRYKQYFQQMQAVVMSFESVAGVRNAAPFAHFAFKALSKHFRCLKNAISDQLQFMTESSGHIAHQKDNDMALGFENTGAGLECQRPMQNVGFGEHRPVWRPQRGLPERAVTVLRAWLFEHFLHPYPTDTDKLMLAKQTGLSRNQVSNWFINARVRLWKPMVEEIHMLETRQAQKASQKDERNADRQADVFPTSNPISCEKTSTSTQRMQDFPSKRTRNGSSTIPIGSEDDIHVYYDDSPRHPCLGVGVSSSSRTGGVSLTLGLHQNNGFSLPDPFPINAARRFGLDANGEGYVMGGIDGTNRQFGREIIGGQLLRDFVG